MRTWSAPVDLTSWILQQRPPRNTIDPWRAYGAFVEAERDPDGVLRDVATLLLTNRECPFKCLMCDLWRNTLEQPTPHGAIPAQIKQALADLPPADNIKLYNAGNFFDRKAIPADDWSAIVECVQPFGRVIVESHPKLISRPAVELKDALHGQLEIAIGLETAHADTLALLNKDMSLDEFAIAVRFCREQAIDVRCFILLRPPLMSESEGLDWARRSIDFAFNCGVQCCAVVPTRAGNGALEALAKEGLFAEPDVRSLEAAVEYGVQQARGRVFADLWDLARFCHCPRCGPQRRDRLQHINLTQTVPDAIDCDCPPPGDGW